MLAGDVDVGDVRGGGEVKFPRDFGGLLLEFAEIFGLEVGGVHQDAVRDAAVGDRLPGFDDFRGEFDLAVTNCGGFYVYAF